MNHEDRNSVELARGGSHIASTRRVATLKAAVAEVLDDFVTRHGGADSVIFLELLAARLEKRKLPWATAMERRVAVVGAEQAFEEATNVERERRPLAACVGGRR